MEIWKYPVVWDLDLEVSSVKFSHEMPKGAEILAVQLQDREPQIWALVDENAEKETRTFRVIGTGHEIRGGDGLVYVGTFQKEVDQWIQASAGIKSLVWHLFEVVN